MPIISVKNLNVSLNSHRILESISFDINQGEITAIIGPNGSGKTTLLKALLGLTPYTGDIKIFNSTPRKLHEIAHKIGYVPQRLEFDRTIPMTIKELFSLHLLKGQTEDSILKTLDLIRARHLIDKRVGILSGGEFQRIILALALLNDPELLLLDEPSSNVDAEGVMEFYSLIKELRAKKNLTILLVSHDIDVVYKYATSVLCVSHKLLCHASPSEALTTETLERLYGKHQKFFAHENNGHV